VHQAQDSGAAVAAGFAADTVVAVVVDAAADTAAVKQRVGKRRVPVEKVVVYTSAPPQNRTKLKSSGHTPFYCARNTGIINFNKGHPVPPEPVLMHLG